MAACENPYKPGAGHSPPYLAGRSGEVKQFAKLLDQDAITQNVVLTGLRGIGKTVLMDDEYKRLAITKGWVWLGTDFSEAAFVDESALCTRLLIDLAVFTSGIAVQRDMPTMGLKGVKSEAAALNYPFLLDYFEARPGLMGDKLKETLQLAWRAIEATGHRGVLFAYDEAQVVRDRKDKDQYPLALLLEVFQSLQRRGLRYMLLLTGLPTLFGKLVESRTYAERMFTVQEIGRLPDDACREAIERPLQKTNVKLTPESIQLIANVSQGYPYFVQFICREVYDLFSSHLETQPESPLPKVPIEPIIRKLDTDFFAGRWANVPDRQRELLASIAHLPTADEEFTISEIVEMSKTLSHLSKPFRAGDVAQMFPKLIDAGLIYRTRHGKYCFAVPMFSGYIKRQFRPLRERVWPPPDQKTLW